MKTTEIRPLRITPAMICFALLVLFGVVNTLSVFRAPVSDFGNYFYGAKMVGFTSLSSDFLYDVGLFNDYAQRVGKIPLFLNHCTVTPQTDLLYLPFALFEDVLLAKCVFNWFGIVLFVAVLFRYLRRFHPVPDVKILLILIAAIIPVYYNILFGQTYLIITSLVMIMILCLEKYSWISGFCLAITIALKISPAILLIWLLSEKKFKAVGWTILFWAVITGATALAYLRFGDAMIPFYTEAMPRMMNGFVSDPYSSSFQGFIVFLRKLMLPDAILNPDALINGSERLIQLINTLFFIGMSVLLVGAWKKVLDWKKKILLLLLLMNITSGYTSTYSMLFLVPFISFSANPVLSSGESEKREFARNGINDWIRMMLYAALFMFPPRIFDGYSPFLEEYKLWIFIALFILEIRNTFSFRRFEKAQLIVGIIFLSMVIMKLAHRPEELPLTYYRPDLAKQDYVINAVPVDNSIQYISYADGAFRVFTIPVDENWEPVPPATGKVHGVRIRFIGKNGGNYLVLSDYRRGPGLYHMYTISKRELEAISQ